MRKSLLTLLATLLLGIGSASAQQKMSIESFTHDPMDLAAKDAKTDVNGDKYALVKVRPAAAEFQFTFGYMKCVVDENPHDDETWLWVQKNARRVTIKRQGYKTISNQDLGMTLQAGQTYILQLTSEELQLRKAFLKFVVEPAEVSATVKYKPYSADDSEYTLLGATLDGVVSTSSPIECRQYAYTITAPNYEPTSGTVSLNKPNETVEEKVTLRPNFGYLSVPDQGGFQGATIYVNDEKIGTIPYAQKRQWESGEYAIMVSHGELYKDYNGRFTIVNGQTTTVEVRLASNAAETTLKVEDGSEIFVDGQSKGKGTWTGPLKAGRYTVECRRENYRPSRRTNEVKADVPDAYLLDSPTPITGTLAANANREAIVSIDGQDAGATPIMQDIIIGRHTVTFTRKGFKPETREVTIEEGKTAQVSVELNSVGDITFRTTPTLATMWLDGKQVGTTPVTTEVASGDHRLRFVRRGYKDYDRTVNLDPSQPEMTFALQRTYLKKSCFYVGLGFQAGQMMALGAQLGAYISHVNIEVDGALGVTGSEKVYFINTQSSTGGDGSATYKPTYIGGRLGYGIDCGNRLRLTPQLGFGVVSLKAKDGTGSAPESTYAANASLGLRAEFAVTPWFTVCVRPEYALAVKQGDIYTMLADVSSQIKGFATGFNAHIGLNFCF